ncbi:MAG: ABC transporter ATP-binding protein [Clostridia bacterium]|nr:ABC transporter ATP-binding protein [Clostridia bacterium]
MDPRQQQNPNNSKAPEKLSGERKKNVIIRLWYYLKQMKMPLIAVWVMVVVANLLSLVGPKLSGEAIDAIDTESGIVDFETVYHMAALMLIFYTVSSILSVIQSRSMIKISKRITFNIRKDLHDRLSMLPVKFFDSHQNGEIISTMSYDVDTVSASLSNDLIHICTGGITIIGSFVMMVSISPVLVLVFAVTLPISFALAKYRTKKVRPLFRRRSGKLGEMNGYGEEAIGGLKTIKAYEREEVILSRFDVKNDEAVDAYYQADYHACVTGPSVNFVNNLTLALISLFGVLLYLYDPNAMTLGAISSFVLYSRKFAGPINEITNLWSELQSALAAGERVFRLMDEPIEPPDKETAVSTPITVGNVEFDHVRFGYTEEKTIIHDLSLSVPSGATVAIVGPTGAGKTTLVNLLMRFYDVSGGSIKIDGVDIRDRTRESLRSAFTMVLQDTWLFGGTVYENIAYGKEGVTREQVENVAKAAKIHNFITCLPDGYDTVLTDNGTNISKGQKQLLTIARAMLPQSSILILDEATSNVDTRTEEIISEAMLNLMKNKTCFVIAHRLSTIRHADIILVVRDGDIVERGRHEELLAKNGFYAELYNSQFEAY